MKRFISLICFSLIHIYLRQVLQLIVFNSCSDRAGTLE
jgi:hypothetical protein